jgi:acyl carrier protein
MGGSQRDVHETIRSFLTLVDKAADFDRSTPLFADGLGLDSLETAELSAVLEDEYGKDPFSSDIMPQTVGDIVDFYDAAVAGA